MTAIVQIIREYHQDAWSDKPAVQSVIRSMSFEDVATAKEYAKDFGEQYGADYESTYTAKIVETTAPSRYAVLHLVSFGGHKYHLSDTLISVETMNPAQKKAFENNGAYSLTKDGEVKELEPGMVANGNWWTSDASLAEDFNSAIHE